MNGGFVEAVSKWLVVVLVKFFFVGIKRKVIIFRLAVVCELDLLGIRGLWMFSCHAAKVEIKEGFSVLLATLIV